jgi:hypothetical protein
MPTPPSTARVKPTREQALRIAERRKAARRWRNRRMRRAIAVVSVAAFIGPFGIIYTQLASGNDPALASTKVVATTSASATQAQAASTQTTQTTSAAPAAVTTQQS